LKIFLKKNRFLFIIECVDILYVKTSEGIYIREVGENMIETN